MDSEIRHWLRERNCHRELMARLRLVSEEPEVSFGMGNQPSDSNLVTFELKEARLRILCLFKFDWTASFFQKNPIWQSNYLDRVAMACHGASQENFFHSRISATDSRLVCCSLRRGIRGWILRHAKIFLTTQRRFEVQQYTVISTRKPKNRAERRHLNRLRFPFPEYKVWEARTWQHRTWNRPPLDSFWE